MSVDYRVGGGESGSASSSPETPPGVPDAVGRAGQHLLYPPVDSSTVLGSRRCCRSEALGPHRVGLPSPL
jgi:hypothetical protein